MVDDFSVRIGNQATINADAGEVEVFGFDGEDTLEFYGGQDSITGYELANRVILNGLQYRFDAEQFRSFDVHDVESATLHGNDGDDRFYSRRQSRYGYIFMPTITLCVTVRSDTPTTNGMPHFEG